MGVTYKAVNLHLRSPVALKIINARLIGDASARHRFVREARAAASVRHPNVASVFHLGESDGDYFITSTPWSLSMARHWRESSADPVGCRLI
jgi:serine/threonine protein kinase